MTFEYKELFRELNQGTSEIDELVKQEKYHQAKERIQRFYEIVFPYLQEFKQDLLLKNKEEVIESVVGLLENMCELGQEIEFNIKTTTREAV